MLNSVELIKMNTLGRGYHDVLSSKEKEEERDKKEE